MQLFDTAAVVDITGDDTQAGAWSQYTRRTVRRSGL